MTDTATLAIPEARRALLAAAQRSGELIRSIDNMELPVPQSEWTVGETAAHLIFALRGFSASARGAFGEWEEVAALIPPLSAPERVKAVNRLFIPAEPQRSPAEAAQAISDGAAAFLDATARHSPEQSFPTPWYGEAESLTVGQATCLLLGEQVMHGYDMAKAARRKWPISTSDARLILGAVQAMMPKMANPKALAGVSATYRVHPGGKGDFVVRCADGAIRVDPLGSQRIDCHIAADPVAFLLLGYGRTSQWRPIARGKMMTWGRKPWLAFRFAGFMNHP